MQILKMTVGQPLISEYSNFLCKVLNMSSHIIPILPGLRPIMLIHLHTAEYKFTLVHVNPHEAKWVHMSSFHNSVSSYESNWVHEFQINPWVPRESICLHICPYEFTWAHMSLLESKWVHMGPYVSTANESKGVQVSPNTSLSSNWVHEGFLQQDPTSFSIIKTCVVRNSLQTESRGKYSTSH